MKLSAFSILSIVAAGTLLRGQPLDVMADERAIAEAIVQLADAAPTTRESAASRIRAIVAKYPSGTTNLREADGGEARWRAKLAEIKAPVISADFISRIGGTMGAAGGSGGASAFLLRLDDTWTLSVGATRSPGQRGSIVALETLSLKRDSRPVHISPPPTFSGVWTVWRTNGQKWEEYTATNGQVVGSSRHFDDKGQPISQ